MSERYNGWANYATWRINLEFGLSDGLYGDYNAEQLRKMVEESLECECGNETTLSYAMAFVDDVNWYEIAQNLKEEGRA